MATAGGKGGNHKPTPASSHGTPKAKGAAPAPSATGDSAAKKRARRLELIDYPEDAPIIDHKGRTKPLYKPQSPRPETWRPGKPARLLLGLFPGLRLMALESLRAGLLYAVLGTISFLGCVFMISRFEVTVERLQHLRLRPDLILLYAGAIWTVILSFELLRLGSALAERNKGPRAPRLLATLVIPTAAILLGAPALVHMWPRLLEAAWLASAVLLVGSLPPAFWCLLDSALKDEDQQRLFRRVTGAFLALVVSVLIGVLVTGSNDLSKSAEQAGFELIPGVLRR